MKITGWILQYEYVKKYVIFITVKKACRNCLLYRKKP